MNVPTSAKSEKAADDEILVFALGRGDDSNAGRRLSRQSGCLGREWALGDSFSVTGIGCLETAELIQRVLAAFTAELERGSLITVKAGKITCHKLPIGSSE